jgi:hypothetical protein
MNGNWYPWGGTVNGNTPAAMVAAWRHIHDIFVSEGATNVKFVWCPNVDSVPNTSANSIASYWPGDGYVDMVGLDGYNFGGTAWRSFSQTFSSAYAKVTSLTSKPVIVAEIACAGVGGNKPAWISDMFKVIPASFPRIAGIAWFDANKECDWRIESDTASLAAFVAGEKAWAASTSGSDTVAPTTTSDAVASYAGSAIIHLSANDGPSGSGVSGTYYTLDGGLQVKGTTLQATALGTHTLRFWSVDNVGNAEGARTVTFQVTAPDTTAPRTTSDAIATYAGTANIHLTATDEAGGSGIAHTYYTVDGGSQGSGTAVSVRGIGQHTVDFWSADDAGNVESPHGHVAFAIVTGNSADTSSPITRSDARTSYTANATIHLIATDNDGVAATFYILDGGPRVQGTQLLVSSSGRHSLAFWSIDEAGNVEMPTTVEFTVSGATTPTTVAPSAPRVTIGASTVRALVPRPFVLAGQLDPGRAGGIVVVMVKKPGSARWSYSSARLTYGSDGVGGCRWWYRYTPTMRGSYRFTVRTTGCAAPVSGVSPVVNATLH